MIGELLPVNLRKKLCLVNMNKYSITSNEIKLYKHLDSLQRLQNKNPAPIQLHLSPTNNCGMKCIHCCFLERDKNQILPFEKLIEGYSQFKNLGIKSVEFTGGGEPSLYPWINEAIEYINLPMGMNTNALYVDKIRQWNKLKWVRIAMNIFDSRNDKLLEKFKKNVNHLRGQTKITACYIVPKEIELKNLNRVVKFANEEKIYTRIAPDCIQTKDQINHMIDHIKRHMDMFDGNNEYAICSDFNVYLFENEICAMHLIKPFLYTDGWVYCCPSSELAIENNRTMQEKYRVCHVNDIYDYYTNEFETFYHKCSYCKYALQNNIIDKMLTKTDNNDFV